MRVARTLVACDNASIRRSVRELVDGEPDMQVIAEAQDGPESIRKALELKPDLVLLDLTLSGMNGLTVTRKLKGEMPGIQVILLTMFDMQLYRQAAELSGASDCVVKALLVQDLVPTIRNVLHGQYDR